VVRIADQIGAHIFQGSGVLISPDEVLTASYVVYQTGLGTATNIDVTPAFSSGTAPFGHAAVAYPRSPKAHYHEFSCLRVP